MQRFSNITGQARHGLEKMTPAGLMSRPNQMDMAIAQPIKRPINGQPLSPHTPVDTIVNLSFNVPFASSLPGPDVEEILHATPKALERWTFPDGADKEAPIHKLPVHHGNVEQLRRLCRVLEEGSQGRLQATVTSSEPKPVPALQRRPLKGLVTNVCISGDAEIVQKMRAKILNETPIALVNTSQNRVADENADTNIVTEMCNSRRRHEPYHQPRDDWGQSGSPQPSR